ncbi:hypothetical protein CU098_003478, partial [Rhizopus stolonifer]
DLRDKHIQRDAKVTTLTFSKAVNALHTHDALKMTLQDGTMFSFQARIVSKLTMASHVPRSNSNATAIMKKQ